MADADTNANQRELGSFFQQVSELRHDIRNLKQELLLLDDNQRRLERELMELRAELKTFQAKTMTLCATLVALVTACAWALEFYTSIGV
jgi:chromosome segregation ATPase